MADYGKEWEVATRTRPVAERIKDRLVVDERSGCWQWTGSKSPEGYGRIYVGSRTDGSRTCAYVHRLNYEIHVGVIPPGLEIDHLCRNRACANPEHLEPVTARVNMHRSQAPCASQVAQTHCKRGHAFTPDNTYLSKGKRTCRTCRLERARKGATA